MWTYSQENVAVSLSAMEEANDEIMHNAPDKYFAVQSVPQRVRRSRIALCTVLLRGQ